MSAVLLALTLAIVVPPAPGHPAHASVWGGYVTGAGCPAPAIGFYRFKPHVKTLWGGLLVQNSESYGGSTAAGGMYDGTLHFWSNRPGQPHRAAVAVVDPGTHALHAIAGTVRKVGDVWCMFSMPEPIPAKFLRDPR